MHRPSRRAFLAHTAWLPALAAATAPAASAADRLPREHRRKTSERPLIISTWPFGKPSNERAREVLLAGGSVLDAVEKGINVAEEDLSNNSVGVGGLPNAAGVVQLDACIMDGPTHKAGSVSALEGIANPVSVARRVMEKTPHVMLVGAGAREFALAQGFPSRELLTESSRNAWQEWKAKPKPAPNHDTIALLCLAPDGTLAGGCSTSGLAYKLPGRVGDSPVIGSGLYVDNDVGGAGATGIGENVLRFCGSFMIVELMRQGLHPAQACVEVIRRAMSKHPPGADLFINYIALNKKGEYGAAGTGQGFEFSVAGRSFSQVLRSPGVTAAKISAVGGHIQ
jgi:isoaspartyl peptidase/L-asparaginase-like protein (Ntn-hydrolase superfamily)